MTDLLIDLEALGTHGTAPIVEIAALRFDLATGETGDCFHRYVSPLWQGSPQEGALEWAMEHGTFPHPAVRNVYEIATALEGLREWIAGADHPVGNVWAWGASYDFPVLGHAWERHMKGAPLPWRYFQARCARTVWELAFPGIRRPDRPHQALEDCRAAVDDLHRALVELTGKAVAA